MMRAVDVAELQRRLEDDGYLFFRRLLDPLRLLNLRREMLTVMQAGGWLVEGTEPVDGIANPEARSTEGDIPVLPKITKYLDQAFEEAIQLVRSGDERARLHLRRIVLRDPESAQGKMAASVLDAVAVR